MRWVALKFGLSPVMALVTFFLTVLIGIAGWRALKK
jgi:hypothetical protein